MIVFTFYLFSTTRFISCHIYMALNSIWDSNYILYLNSEKSTYSNALQ